MNQPTTEPTPSISRVEKVLTLVIAIGFGSVALILMLGIN